MGTLGQKLDYLTDTKSILKQKINNLGGSLTNQSTFRSYGNYLDELYDEMPKVTGSGTEITLTPTRKGRMQLDLKGNTSQDSTTGKNLWGGKTFTTSQYQVDFTINIDGTVTANGTATSNAVSGTITQYNNNQMYKTLSAGTYTVSKNSNKIQLQVYDTLSNIIKTLTTTQDSGSFTLESSTDIIVRIMVPSGTSVNETFILQLEEGSTATDYEPYTGGVPSPNPDYPQHIHVVTGNNSIGVQGKNLFDKDNYNIKSLNAGGGGTFASASNQKHIYIQCKPNTDYVVVKNVSNIPVLGIYETENEPAVGIAYTSLYFSSNSDGKRHVTTSATAQYLDVRINTDAITQAEIDAIVETLIIAEGTDTNISYVPYYHADYPINLGNIELCKIGDYQDYLYKENGNWYKYGAIENFIVDGTETWRKSDVPGVVKTQRFSRDAATSHIVNIGYCDKMKVKDESTPMSSDKELVQFSATASNKYIGIQINIDRLSSNTVSAFKEWLTNNNLHIYRALETATTTQITDETLIAQLDAIENAMSTTGTTTITQTNSDLPFIITASALKPFTTETLTTSLTDGE